MDNIGEHFKLNLKGKANSQAIVQGDNYRFTVLTDRMLRIEYDPDGVFEDRPTQTVWFREFEVPEFRVVDRGETLEISTEYFHLHYKKGELSRNSLYIDIKGNYSNYFGRWYFGDCPRDLKGTCRTLDKVDGAVELEHGLCSFNGHSNFDDSKSLVITNDGWIEPRKKEVVDIYYFGYGREYRECIKDFYRLTGATPLLPRYALGNWWSRYYKYTQQEYINLMERFSKEEVPFSVAVIDMDWHVVDVPRRFGRGWTGYTWNTQLFPKPEEFMQWLHNHNLRVSLNLHPADGVHAHEEMYVPMAKDLDIDYHNEDPIKFNLTDKRFFNAYFKYLHHPMEEEGVDFWWIDWQQGSTSTVEGLDPLWLLNHYHTYDIARNGKRPLLLSRYGGLGSHRYPVGFSGDTFITWDSLKFQPYFTATASNVGYGWWSHDIGGHMKGYKDDELIVRWVQLGVFSPINRLHSNNSIFTGKEPWKYTAHAEKVMKEYLRLRHHLIPYLYTMNWKCHRELAPLIQPMYYSDPDNRSAYKVQNQFWFGSELIVCPITDKINPKYFKAPVDAWLPKGNWVDFFDGTVYSGNKHIRMFRTLENIPVLAQEGAIVPAALYKANENQIDNPIDVAVYVFPGASNVFEMYEDEGDNNNYMDGCYVVTAMKQEWSASSSKFTINASTGDLSVIPASRNYTICFRGYNDTDNITVTADGHPAAFEKNYDVETHTIKVIIQKHPSNRALSVTLHRENLMNDNTDFVERAFDFIYTAQIEYDMKEELFRIIQKSEDKYTIISQLCSLNLDKDLVDILVEIIYT